MTRRLFNTVGEAQAYSTQMPLFNLVGAPVEKSRTGATVAENRVNTDAPVIYSPSGYAPIGYSPIGVIAALVLLLAWGAQCLLHSSAAPAVTGFAYISAGMLLVRLCTRHVDALAAFVLTFALCNAVAAAVQAYSITWFATPTSTLDANTFLRLIAKPIDTNLDAMKSVVNAPLAVFVWQVLFAGWSKIGLSGIWVGVQFNALMVALCAALTQAVARLALGNSEQTLRYGVWLAGLCGLNLLFGAVLIRDAFAMLFNAVALYGIARFLTSPHALSYALALLLNAVCALGMFYIREKSVYLFPMFMLLASGIYLLGDRLTPARLGLAAVATVVLMLGFTQLSASVDDAVQASDQKAAAYSDGSEVSSRQGSLGVALIVKQPAPIKAVLGSAYLFVQPIPLWGFFNTSLVEYLWVKGYQGLYAVVIFPSLILSSLLMLRRDMRNPSRTGLRRFLVAYFILTTALVALTSMETRHHGQFYPAYLILAMAAWRPGNVIDRARLSFLRGCWFLAIVAGHLMWLVLR